MKKIGLFFGMFNPIHNGHLRMANYIINYTDINSVLFVVNPTAPFKEKDNLLSFKDRMEMADLATFKYRHIQATDIENNLPLPAYTYNTFRYYDETYKGKFEFALILGCDNLKTLSQWKNATEIIENHEIYVCPRNEIDYDKEIIKINDKFKAKGINVIKDIPEYNISSTFIRQQIKESKDIGLYVPIEVKEYIEENKFYL